MGRPSMIMRHSERANKFFRERLKIKMLLTARKLRLREFGFQPKGSVLLATRTRALATVYKTVVAIKPYSVGAQLQTPTLLRQRS